MKAIRLLLVSFLVVCVSTTNVVASKESDKNSVIDQTYPQAQAEVLNLWINLSLFMLMETSLLNSMEECLSIVRVMNMVNANYLVKI